MNNNSILVLATKSITINIFLKEIINELSQSCNVILGSSDIDELKDFNQQKISFIFPIKFWHLFNPFYIFYCVIINRKKIKQNNINCIFLNTPLAAHIIRTSCIFLNIKIVYFVHGYRFHPNGNILSNFIFFYIEKILSFFTSAYININNIDFDITKKFFKKKSLYVNGVGINLKIKKNTFINFKNKNNFIIGYIAAYKKNKGYEDLLKLAEMFKNYSNIHIICYGYGNLHYYQKKIQLLNLKNIQLNHFEKNILNKIKNFDILLSLSYREGLPISFLECMSQGIPVLSYNIRGAKDLIVNDYNGHTFNKKNIGEIFDKIIILSKNNDKLSKISNNSYKYIDNKFDKTIIAKQIVEFINNV